jgi:hypothetical protein
VFNGSREMPGSRVDVEMDLITGVGLLRLLVFFWFMISEAADPRAERTSNNIQHFGRDDWGRRKRETRKR